MQRAYEQSLYPPSLVRMAGDPVHALFQSLTYEGLYVRLWALYYVGLCAYRYSLPLLLCSFCSGFVGPSYGTWACTLNSVANSGSLMGNAGNKRSPLYHSLSARRE